MTTFHRVTEIEGVEVLRETDAAILCRVAGGAEVWIPLSQIDAASEVNGAGDEGTLVITEWLAQEKGLI